MNKINIGKEIKISMLGIIGGTLILTLGEIMLSPLPEKNISLDRSFPEEFSLSGLSISSSNLPQHFNANKLETIPGKSYSYNENNSLVNIQLHYITERQDVQTLLKQYTYLPHQSLEVLQQEKIGYYGVLVHQDKLHLSSCITPKGSIMASDTNFYQSYPAFKLIYNRLAFWLLGEKPIVENVCLWSHLSMPIADSSPEQAYPTLEKVWFSWYKHWHPYLVTVVNKN